MKIKIFLFILLIAVIGAVGTYLYYTQNIFGQNQDQSQQVSKAQQISLDMFKWYLDFKGHALLSGSYKSQVFFSTKFIEEMNDSVKDVEKILSSDPLICSQDKPYSYKVVDEAFPETDRSIVTVNFDYYGDVKPITVKLSRDSNQLFDVYDGWKIDSVECPQKEIVQKKFQIILYFAKDSNLQGKNPQCDVVYSVAREIKFDDSILEQALKLLVMGPTKNEKLNGFASVFSEKTGNIINTVNIDIQARTAHIDFNEELITAIPNIYSKCVREQFFAQIEETTKQDGSVSTFVYTINQSQEQFQGWLNTKPTE